MVVIKKSSFNRNLVNGNSEEDLLTAMYFHVSTTIELKNFIIVSYIKEKVEYISTKS